MKINKALTEALIRILNEIFNKNHIIFNNFQDETEVNQNSIFSAINIIIIKKTIFIIDTISQIT